MTFASTSNSFFQVVLSDNNLELFCYWHVNGYPTKLDAEHTSPVVAYFLQCWCCVEVPPREDMHRGRSSISSAYIVRADNYFRLSHRTLLAMTCSSQRRYHRVRVAIIYKHIKCMFVELRKNSNFYTWNMPRHHMKSMWILHERFAHYNNNIIVLKCCIYCIYIAFTIYSLFSSISHFIILKDIIYLLLRVTW